MNNKLSKLKRIAIFLAGTTALLLFGSASAAIVKTTIVGHIATISPLLQGKGMAVDDPFELFFTFDDSLGVATQVVINGGDLWTVVTDRFVADTANWSGSLPTYMASLNHGPTQDQWVSRESWFRPIDTLHEVQWNTEGGLLMITNVSYPNHSSQAYGWLNYSSPDSLEFLIDSVVTIPIPEPETYAMLLAGLGLIGFSVRRRKQNT